jgi:hypothetical protein
MEKNAIIQIILTIFLSLLIAFLAYYLLIYFVVDANPQYSQQEITRVNNLLNFYEQSHDQDIFIVGSSLVNEGIDASVVEDSFIHQNIYRSVYILGINADNPLNRVAELDYLINSRPKIVIIGLSYRDLTKNNTIFAERTLRSLQKKQINDRSPINEELQSFFNDSKLISETPSEQFFDKRKFLFPAFDHILHPNSIQENAYVTNFKNPWVHDINKTNVEKTEIVKTLSKNYSESVYPINNEANIQERALLYTIRHLQQNNISVIIINMPVNPLLFDVINESSRKNLSNFLNSTGVPWYNYEQEYSSEYFTDTGHLNAAGRTDFSPKIAARLSDYLKNGA